MGELFLNTTVKTKINWKLSVLPHEAWNCTDCNWVVLPGDIFYHESILTYV